MLERASGLSSEKIYFFFVATNNSFIYSVACTNNTDICRFHHPFRTNTTDVPLSQDNVIEPNECIIQLLAELIYIFVAFSSS